MENIRGASLVIIDQGADGFSESYAYNCEREPFAEAMRREKMGKTSAISASAMIHPPRKIPEKRP